MSKVGVWLPCFNEEKHLRGTIESVLAQSFKDLTLYISNNWSTDSSLKIIDEFAKNDERIVIWHPPEHLAGIPHMRYCWDKLTAETDHTYTIHIGGHDTWPPGHLQMLVEHLDARIPTMLAAKPQPIEIALLYTDVMQVDHARQVVGRYMDVMQIGQIPRAMVPHFCITGVNSPHLFGLWHEKIRKQLKVRHACGGWDHLIVAEAALMGQILYEGRTAIHMLGPDPDPRGLLSYGEKHFSKERLAAGMQDYLDQLEYYVSMIDKSLDYCPVEALPLHRALHVSAMIGIYIALRGQNLLAVPGAMEEFNNDPNVKAILGGAQHIEHYTNLLLESRKPIGD